MQTTPYPAPKTCPTCGRGFSKRDDQTPSQFARQVNCSVDCGRRARHLRAQRDRPRRKTSDGRYWLRFVPGRVDAPSRTNRAGAWVLEHRLVVEHQIGRELNPDEHVHHVNEDGLDNRIENLRLLSKGEHSRLHALERKHPPAPRISCTCPVCGTMFSMKVWEYRKRKRKAKTGLVVCSTRCAASLSPPPPLQTKTYN